MGAAGDSVHGPGGLRQELPAARCRAANPARPSAGSRESEARLRVLKAASDLIDRLSYDDVTIDAVARASGVSKSTAFLGKQALVLGVISLVRQLGMRAADRRSIRQTQLETRTDEHSTRRQPPLRYRFPARAGHPGSHGRRPLHPTACGSRH